MYIFDATEELTPAQAAVTATHAGMVIKELRLPDFPDENLPDEIYDQTNGQTGPAAIDIEVRIGDLRSGQLVRKKVFQHRIPHTETMGIMQRAGAAGEELYTALETPIFAYLEVNGLVPAGSMVP